MCEYHAHNIKPQQPWARHSRPCPAPSFAVAEHDRQYPNMKIYIEVKMFNYLSTYITNICMYPPSLAEHQRQYPNAYLFIYRFIYTHTHTHTHTYTCMHMYVCSLARRATEAGPQKGWQKAFWSRLLERRSCPPSPIPRKYHRHPCRLRRARLPCSCFCCRDTETVGSTRTTTTTPTTTTTTPTPPTTTSAPKRPLRRHDAVPSLSPEFGAPESSGPRITFWLGGVCSVGQLSGGAAGIGSVGDVVGEGPGHLDPTIQSQGNHRAITRQPQSAGPRRTWQRHPWAARGQGHPGRNLPHRHPQRAPALPRWLF